jgi:RimJ/RimL family protein N-acetyltransferase
MSDVGEVMEITSGTFSEELRSGRVVLRRLTAKDAPILSAYRSLPEVARYQSWETFTPEDATVLVRCQVLTEPNIPGTWFQFAITHATSGVMIGDCGLHCRRDLPHTMEIGITLAPLHQRRGYGSEAIRALLHLAFERYEKHRVFAVTDARNEAAAQMFLKSGFRQEAHLVEHVWFKGGWGSEYIFAILRDEWLRHPARHLAYAE